MRLYALDSVDEALAWLAARGASRLVVDSRRAGRGDAFIAWPGHATDARRFVPQALAAGAAACIVECEGADAFAAAWPPLAEPVAVATLPRLKAATGTLASRVAGEPSRSLEMVACTGTNGKTSMAWWTAQALGALGRRCGVVGTLGVGEPPVAGRPMGVVATGLTTPDPITLHAALRDFVDAGFAACAIEASSIGLAEHRLGGTKIDVALFSNFTQDHLDFHGSMAAYWDAKLPLFRWPGLRAAVVNLDDARGRELAAELEAGHSREGAPALWTYAMGRPARLRANAVSPLASGLAFDVREGSAAARVETGLVGAFNVSNLLAVIGGLRALGVTLDAAARACADLTPVPGRMQRVTSGPGQPQVVIDYAHTPDALEQALRALQPFAAERGGRLWCVFGCGGNRDAGKRPLMGEVAARLAGRVVVTSDNPRREAPGAIIAQVLGGVAERAGVQAIERRDEAIDFALAEADARDVILIAGKGHEDYQDVAGVRQPFSDAEQAVMALRARTQAAASCTAAMTLGLVHSLLPGSTLVGDPATPIARVHTDTRSLRAGDLFVALRGERFDAHDFIAQARAAGAAAVLAESGIDAASGPGLLVEDTQAALGALAGAWRRRFSLPLIAVTGSNGKTTVTQMIASILQAWCGDAAFATVGNLNNHIGVPLTLLRLAGHHRAGVVELGMNHPGEIAQLAALAAPTVALVNNAQREHLEFMQSVAAVARENGAVIESLDAAGIAVFPADDDHAPTWRSLAGSRRVSTFALRTGASRPADVTGEATGADGRWRVALATPHGDAVATLAVAGLHNVMNALAATACALAAGCPLEAVVRGLEAFTPVKGRSQVRTLRRGGSAVTLIDDTYNANPDSVRAAIDVLAALPAPRWFVLGDMGEVGVAGPQFHREAGARAKSLGIESLWTAGRASTHAADAFAGARHFDDVPSLIAALEHAPPHASVVVKGSRFMQMERVVAALMKDERIAQHHETRAADAA